MALEKLVLSILSVINGLSLYIVKFPGKQRDMFYKVTGAAPIEAVKCSALLVAFITPFSTERDPCEIATHPHHRLKI